MVLAAVTPPPLTLSGWRWKFAGLIMLPSGWLGPLPVR
jgi:hypothetical protein